MANQRLGKLEDAQQWMHHAEMWFMEKTRDRGSSVHPADWAEFNVLIREARTVVPRY